MKEGLKGAAMSAPNLIAALAAARRIVADDDMYPNAPASDAGQAVLVARALLDLPRRTAQGADMSPVEEATYAIRNWIDSDVVPLRLHAEGMAALCDAADLLRGMVGLVDLVLSRDDLTDDLRSVLTSNHRIVDARAALSDSEARQS